MKSVIISCYFTVVCTLIQPTHKNKDILFWNPNHTKINRKVERPKNLKYILLWELHNRPWFLFHSPGQETFIKYKCPFNNCFVTTNRSLFKITKFHAIAFHGHDIFYEDEPLPERRTPNQRYIFFNMESCDNFPVCNHVFDNFFNWTVTYRLNSDFPSPYITIKNMNNEVVGPKVEMHWEDTHSSGNKELYVRWHKKSKAAAWFVSSCDARSNRTEVAMMLRKAMARYNMSLYIFGKCGDYRCPRSKTAECNKLLADEFYFYLSFENSLCEDYVTEKLLTALKYDTVPIVLGGANYSRRMLHLYDSLTHPIRFLPPGSYLHAFNQTPEELAAIMHSIIKLPQLYQNYFKWKNHYTFGYSAVECACSICAALNNDTTKRSYKHFRRWWNSDYKERCGSDPLKSQINMVLLAMASISNWIFCGLAAIIK